MFYISNMYFTLLRGEVYGEGVFSIKLVHFWKLHPWKRGGGGGIAKPIPDLNPSLSLYKPLTCDQHQSVYRIPYQKSSKNSKPET